MDELRCLSLTLLCLCAWCALSCADVGDFAPCLNFFYQDWPPKGISGTPICQRFDNQYRFATLYGRPRRTPWFSGYMFSPPQGKRPKAQWKYEPQLANAKANGSMTPFPQGELDQNVVESQAVMDDYINSTFTRGHLNPSLHHGDRQDREATFTLTNVVPQRQGSNDGPWSSLEQRVTSILTSYCLGQAYVVTGAIPYEVERWMKKRVAVPEYLWSAYCCPHYSPSLPKSLRDVFPTYAAIGRNDPNSTEEIVPVQPRRKKAFLGYDVRSMDLPTLEMYLQQRLGSVVSVFHEQCSGTAP